MWGAIIGDLAGSIYEFSQIKNVTPIKVDNLISNKAFFSDDTILTIAILDAVLNDKNYEKYLKIYGKKYQNYKPDFTPYFKSTFSLSFTNWINSNKQGISKGNGAMMRISSIGYLFETEEDVLKHSTLATIPSHNSKEAIECANMIAMIIYLARKGFTKEEIIKKLNIKLNYRDFSKFNTTCYETIDNCLYALFTTNSFEEAIKKVISYGADTDTNACITGSMAEALYGIDESIINEASKKIPDEFAKVLKIGYSKIV